MYSLCISQGFWCHNISPVFFGRSTRSLHVTKAEIRRRLGLTALEKSMATAVTMEAETDMLSTMAPQAAREAVEHPGKPKYPTTTLHVFLEKLMCCDEKKS